MQKTIFLIIFMALSVSGVFAQSKCKNWSEKYNKKFPSLYLTLEKRANISLMQLAKSKGLVLFRLHNNLKTGIRIETSGAEDGLGGASIYYDVLDQKGAVIQSHPCHVCSSTILRGGKSLLFTIPKNEVHQENALRLDFEYLWETDEPTLLGQEPIHQVVIRFEKLKIDWSKLDL